MKIKLDENMPGRLKAALVSLGYEADTVADEGLTSASDPDVWTATQKDGRFLITQDVYFTDVRDHPPGSHHGVLVLRFHGTGRGKVYDRVLELMKNADVTAWEGCNVVADDERVRVRRP